MRFQLSALAKSKSHRFNTLEISNDKVLSFTVVSTYFVTKRNKIIIKIIGDRYESVTNLYQTINSYWENCNKVVRYELS